MTSLSQSHSTSRDPSHSTSLRTSHWSVQAARTSPSRAGRSDQSRSVRVARTSQVRVARTSQGQSESLGPVKPKRPPSRPCRLGGRSGARLKSRGPGAARPRCGAARSVGMARRAATGVRRHRSSKASSGVAVQLSRTAPLPSQSAAKLQRSAGPGHGPRIGLWAGSHATGRGSDEVPGHVRSTLPAGRGAACARGTSTNATPRAHACQARGAGFNSRCPPAARCGSSNLHAWWRPCSPAHCGSRSAQAWWGEGSGRRQCVWQPQLRTKEPKGRSVGCRRLCVRRCWRRRGWDPFNPLPPQL